jgi:hypothetical protein
LGGGGWGGGVLFYGCDVAGSDLESLNGTHGKVSDSRLLLVRRALLSSRHSNMEFDIEIDKVRAPRPTRLRSKLVKSNCGDDSRLLSPMCATMAASIMLRTLPRTVRCVGGVRTAPMWRAGARRSFASGPSREFVRVLEGVC